MQWFYEENGKVIGPVSRADIIRLIIQRHIHAHSLVWTEEFGEEWRPVSRSGLVAPLPAGGLKNKKMPFFQIHITRIGEEATLREKVIKKVSEVSSLWAWIFLCVPDGLIMFLQIAAYIKGEAWSLSMPLIAFLALFFIPIIAVISDRKELRSAGVKAPWFVWFLIPSVYFWLRAIALGRGRFLFLCSILFAVLRFVVTTYDPPAHSFYDEFRWKPAVTEVVRHQVEQLKNEYQKNSDQLEKREAQEVHF